MSLAIRRRVKRAKPAFNRQERHKHARLRRSGWRAPTGNNSKQRIGEQGRGATPSPGYRSPVSVRGQLSSGLMPVIVHTLSELARLNPQTQAAVIGRTVGRRKRLELVSAAQQRKLTVANAQRL